MRYLILSSSLILFCVNSYASPGYTPSDVKENNQIITNGPTFFEETLKSGSSPNELMLISFEK
jgi:hypothetical protein